MHVRPLIRRSSASVTASSDAASSPVVGSSRIRIGVSRTIARGWRCGGAVPRTMLRRARRPSCRSPCGSCHDEIVGIRLLARRGWWPPVPRPACRSRDFPRSFHGTAGSPAGRSRSDRAATSACNRGYPCRRSLPPPDRIEESRQQSRDGGLALARRPDDCRHRAGFDAEADVLQYRSHRRRSGT